MNSQECIEKIEENYSERRRKFSSLLSGKEQNLLQGEIIIVFLYAHFEGFITDATSLYIQLANKELSSGIVKLEEKIVFKQNEIWETIFAILGLDVRDFEKECEKIYMSTEEQDFLNTLGAKKGIVRKICAKLANHRNHIAHGGLDRSITMEEVKIISMLALKIIEKFRGFLQEAIEQKRYCKSK